MNRKLLIWILAVLLLPSCSSNAYLTLRNSFSDTDGITTTEASYGSDPLQNITCYIKDNIQIDSSKAIVFIHGGG